MSTEESKLDISITPQVDESKQFTLLFKESNDTFRTLEESVLIPNPYSLDLTKYAPADRVMDLPSFIKLLHKVIDYAQEIEGILENKRILLVEHYAPEEFQSFGNEVISWRVISRQPANMSRDGKSRPQRKTTFAYDLQSSTSYNKVIVVQSAKIDHMLEISVWSKTPSEANARVLWLEKVLRQHTWVFISKGVDRFLWEKRLADTFYNVSNQKLYQRPLHYFVRLDEYESIEYPSINSVEFELSLN